MSNGQQIATTILEQLGGNKFIVMTGSKNFVHGDDHLQFKIGSGTINKATHCRITLLPLDAGYTMTFFKIRGVNVQQLKEFDTIPENMREAFTRETGFDVSMGNMGRK